MSWRWDEVWLDTDVLWFGEKPRGRFGSLAVAAPGLAADPPPFGPIATGLEASRRRRLAKQAARKRRHATRTVPAAALVIGSAAMLSIHALRQGGVAQGALPLPEDPPSETFRLDLSRLEAPVPRTSAVSRKPAPAKTFADVHWHRGSSIGLQYSGRLVGGTQLPVEGVDWVTWSPVTDSVPNRPWRLYGHERTVRSILSVISAYRDAHGDAPRVVIGDISFRDGGRMDQHVSHQNGLDVDVYYPRRDGRLSAPISASQVDRALAQDLLDRFVSAGAKVVFVGYHTGLRGPGGVVVPYPNHENHMHVRFPQPPG
jgi:murein endopeptidase